MIAKIQQAHLELNVFFSLICARKWRRTIKEYISAKSESVVPHKTLTKWHFLQSSNIKFCGIQTPDLKNKIIGMGEMKFLRTDSIANNSNL